MTTEIKALVDLVKQGTADIPINGQIGQAVIQPRVAQLLTGAGYDVDVQDSRGFLPHGLPVWRDKASEQVVETKTRRLINLVVRRNDKVVALFEIESDLNHLREQGVSNSTKRYDVFSIAQGADGKWFQSYQSLERMAAAVWYASGRTLAALEALKSSQPKDHNPRGIGLVVVTGSSRSKDRRILAPRLQALGAHLISVDNRP